MDPTSEEKKALLRARLGPEGGAFADWQGPDGAEGLRTEYPGGVYLSLWWWPRRRFYRCDLGREDTIFLSARAASIGDRFLDRVRQLIRAAQSGRFRNKKTTGELVREEIARRGLTSWMNDTKWREFRKAMETEMPFPPPYLYKTLFEEEAGLPDFSRDVRYLGDYGPEDFAGHDYRVIQWVKVRPRYYSWEGGLTGKAVLHDAEAEFTAILDRLHIPWEEEKGVYTIYGYR